MRRLVALIGLAALLLAGCESDSAMDRAGDDVQSAGVAGAADSASQGPAVAVLNGSAITRQALQQGLYEAAGGEVLSELMLAKLIEQRLAERGLTVSPEAISAEKEILCKTLSPDADQAQRLLQALRQQRGLGEFRFQQMLWRNAGLRMLVQDQVQVTQPALRQAYEEAYGTLYVCRLIVVPSMTQATEVIDRLRAGESFIDLAIETSTDSSRMQGGLLPPISPADATYPKALRTAVTQLTPDQFSPPIALDQGIAIVRLERTIEPLPVKFEEAKPEMVVRVRRRAEQMLMQRLARQMIDEAQILVLDPALQESWQQNRLEAAAGR